MSDQVFLIERLEEWVIYILTPDGSLLKAGGTFEPAKARWLIGLAQRHNGGFSFRDYEVRMIRREDEAILEDKIKMCLINLSWFGGCYV